MSQHLHELCCSVIEDFYGEFYARIYSQLSQKGRFNAHQIAQKSHLPVRQVKSGLASLVQLRLIHHHTTADGTSTYQANTRTAYNILRSGKLVDLARSHFGDAAALVVQEACSLGFTSIAELKERVEAQSKKSEPRLTNGHGSENDSQTITSEQISLTIHHLLEAGYLAKVRAAQFQSGFDARQDVESLMRNRGQTLNVTGRLAQEELQARIDAEVVGRQSTSGVEYGYTPKRSHDEIDLPAGKRLKTADGSAARRANGQNGISSEHNHQGILVSASFGPVATYIRDQYLDETATKVLGQSHGRVLRCAVSQISASDPWRPTIKETWLDFAELRDILNHGVQADGTHGHMNGSAKTNGHDYEETADRFSYGDLDRCCALLAESQFTFILRGASQDQWKIDKDALDGWLKHREILRLMGDRIGPPALRIIRMLAEKGKVDEKSLQETGLLGAKELRQMLGELKQRGFVDLQEVPREAQRQPNRTIFLWFYDEERVRKVLLENLYKTMTRLMQRLKVERRKLSSTLEKVERSDVHGSEDQILSAPELKVLKRWQRLEQWMYGEICRLDDSVAILRDL